MRPTEKDIPAPPCVTESASFAVPVMNKPFHSVSVVVISSVKMGMIISMVSGINGLTPNLKRKKNSTK